MIEIINTVICYNNSNEVLEYVKKVEQLSMSDKIVVVIVINKLDNDTVENLQNALNKIKQMTFLVNAGENLGYMNGMLKGYKEFLRNNNERPKYVIMSNTDINYPDKDFLTKLLYTSYEKSVWCIGPAVYAKKRDNYEVPVVSRRKKRDVKRIIRIFRTPVFNELYFRMSNLKGILLKRSRGTSKFVYAVHGCFFVVTTELANIMVASPFNALLYSEEAYVSETIWHYGKRAYYDSNLLVEHMEHTVTGKLNYKKLSKYIADSMEVVLRDFY